MACSKPVLLTDKVNIWREVEQARAGLISSDDRAGVERQLRYWFSMPPDQRISMGTAARQCFVTHFHVDRLAEELAQLVSDQGRPPQGTAELNPFHRQSSVSMNRQLPRIVSMFGNVISGLAMHRFRGLDKKDLR
jgi:hypothetical protein